MTKQARIAVLILAVLASATALLILQNPPEARYPKSDEIQIGANAYAMVARAKGRIGKPAPDLAFRLIEDDSNHRLGEFRGRVVLLNVWDTHCGPCRAEMPALAAVQRLHGDDLAVISISADRAPLIRKEVSARTLTLPPLSAYAKELGWAASSIIPLTFLIDRVGIIRRVDIGRKTEAELEAAISPYL